MNLEQLREELIADEGCKYTVYKDHLGLETLGIGHLITQQDPEFGQPVGTPVSEQRVHQAFNLDILVTIEDCRRLYPEWDTLPEEVQQSLSVCGRRFALANGKKQQMKWLTQSGIIKSLTEPKGLSKG